MVIGHGVGGAQLTAMLDADRDLEIARAVVSLSSWGGTGPERGWVPACTGHRPDAPQMRCTGTR